MVRSPLFPWSELPALLMAEFYQEGDIDIAFNT